MKPYTDKELRALIRGANRDRDVGGNRVYGPVTPNDTATIGRLAWELLEARKAEPAGRVLCRLWACDARPRCRPCLYRQCDTRIRRKYNCRRVEVRELGGRK